MNRQFDPPVQYVKTSDNVSIAFLTVGEGRPLVFASNIFGAAHDYRQLAWHSSRGWADGLAARGWKAVLYDVRGMGSSDRPPVDWSLDGRVKDLEAVVDHLRLERFPLVGVDIGAATAIAYAARHSGRVSNLALGSPWVSGAAMFDLPDLKVAARAMTDGEREWNVFTTVLANVATGFEDSERSSELAASMRAATSANGLAEYYRTTAEIDLTRLLPEISAPTLVLHFPVFPFGSLELCERVAKGVARAQLAIVHDKTLAGTEHHGTVEALDSFLRGERPASAQPGARMRSAQPLTARETEVLARLAAGLTNKEIAKTLDISVPTVERHLANLYPKIGARRRVDATRYALRRGIVKARD